jgi:hypothetical protein
MTHTWQHEIYLPHWYYTLEGWVNNLHIVPLGWHRWMAWWCCCCRSLSHNEPWSEKIDSPAESPKYVDALCGRSTNTWVLQRGWPASHALARPHGLSLIELERNLKFQIKLDYLVFQTRWFDFDRFNLHRWHAPTMEIGPTSTHAASGRGKAMTVANLRASSGGDGWEEEEEFKVEGELH